jgi:hypothetical protein
MAGRDDFGSNMKTPGGWGGSGGGGMSGMGGAKSSGGVYGYRGMPGARPNTQAIGNWNTGGAMFGLGTAEGAQNALRDMYRPRPQVQPPVQSGPIPPALGPQGVPAGYVPQQPRPNWPPRPQTVGMANYPAQNVGSVPARPPLSAYEGPGPGQFFDLNDYQDPWSAAYGGYRQQGMGYPGQQGTTNWRSNTSTAQQTGGVTKDQSRVPQNNATYDRMGNDFRSIGSW